MANKLEQQYPQFFELNGTALNDGYIYIGVNGLNPETNPIPIFLDKGLAIPISQPLRTTGGYIYYSGSPVSIYFNESNYSITVKNSLSNLIYTILSNDAFSYPKAIDTIEDLATYTGTGLVMVKDINRGGTFVSKTSIEIDPNTGSLYVANGGTVLAKLGGGFWVRQHNGAVNVKWFGAKGDGVTDDTMAFKKAIAFRTIFVPSGSYIINSSISDTSFLNGISILGENPSLYSFAQGVTEIILSGNTTYFMRSQYHLTVKNITFRGAINDVFEWKSGIDGNIVRFNNVTALDCEGAFMKPITAGNGSNMAMTDCRFITAGGSGNALNFSIFDSITNSISVDSLTMTRCWIETGSSSDFKLYSLGRLVLEDCRLVPYNHDGYWITTSGVSPHTVISRSDFGGENSGRKLIDWRGTAGDLVIENSGIFYGDASIGNGTIKLDKAPTFITINNTQGFVDSVPIFDVSNMSDSEFKLLSSTVFNYDKSNKNLINYMIGAGQDSRLIPFLVNSKSDSTKIKPLDKLVGYSGSPFQASGILQNGTRVSGSVVDSIGSAAWGNFITGNSSLNSCFFLYSLNSNGITVFDKLYTVTMYVEVSDFCTFEIQFNGARKQYILSSGGHFVSVSSFIKTGNSASVAYQGSGFFDGQTVKVTRVRYFAGAHTDFYENSMYGNYSATPPIVGENGDIIYNSSIVAGGNIGWICTTAGAPGTWKTFGTISA